MTEILAPPSADLQGQWLIQEPLRRYTSWRIGGPAECLYRPAHLADLQTFLAKAPVTPLTWLGLGSNVLIRDGGVAGTVIVTQAALMDLAFVDGWLRAEAGLSCAQVARFATRHGLADAEFLAGIPGTIGGALAMNAGAFGGETWSHVVAVETIDAGGTIRRRLPSDYIIRYREVIAPAGEWFVAAYFDYPAGPIERSRARIKQLLAQRRATQPTQYPSCGSVFRNPEGDHAARLIDACGLKGFTIGQAQVAEQHANFIINCGGATAHDTEQLIEHVQAVVAGRFGVQLTLEAHLLGQPVLPDRLDGALAASHG